jgi:hypothetical protein
MLELHADEKTKKMRERNKKDYNVVLFYDFMARMHTNKEQRKKGYSETGKS